MWKDVYADFTDLPKHEQQKLFNLIKEEFFSDEEEEMKDAFTAIRETRFNEGLACVHCGSVKVKRNGKYRNRQRYLCRDCGKSFNDLTNTPISGTRYLGKWSTFFRLMVEGYTLPKIAKRLKIHLERLRSVEVEMKNVGSATSKLQLLLPRLEMDRLLLQKLVQVV